MAGKSTPKTPSAKRVAAKSGELTHVNERGEMHMVDVGDKPQSRRVAIAEARVLMNAAAVRAIREERAAKGDVLAVGRLAGIQAAKRTADLIPLCHPLALSHVSVELTLRRWGVMVRARAETVGPTGVEMEAMTAASVSALALYDMLKAVDRGMVVGSVQLMRKSGGQSGTWRRPKERG